MFGYIKPEPQELKVREYEFYKGIYCGLCRTMGKNTTCISKMTLSYDFVFLALCRIALSRCKISFKQRRCMVHPLKKKSMMEINEQLEYCSKASALLNYHKIRDDISDCKGIKRLKSYMVLPYAVCIRKKALDYEQLDKITSQKLALLSDMENSGSESADAPAELFGDILAEIFEFGLDGVNLRIAHELGLHTGRWIYLIDAADDYEADLKTGNYNPFINRNTLVNSDKLRNSLTLELVSIEKSINLIDFDETDRAVENIIKNIIYLGMTQVAEKIYLKFKE